MWSRALAFLAAQFMGMPGLTAIGAGEIIWIDLCDNAHPGRRILFLPGADQDGSPIGACHFASEIVAERRQTPRR